MTQVQTRTDAIRKICHSHARQLEEFVSKAPSASVALKPRCANIGFCPNLQCRLLSKTFQGLLQKIGKRYFNLHHETHLPCGNRGRASRDTACSTLQCFMNVHEHVGFGLSTIQLVSGPLCMTQLATEYICPQAAFRTSQIQHLIYRNEKYQDFRLSRLSGLLVTQTIQWKNHHCLPR